jgi:hypothetical protein
VVARIVLDSPPRIFAQGVENDNKKSRANAEPQTKNDNRLVIIVRQGLPIYSRPHLMGPPNLLLTTHVLADMEWLAAPIDWAKSNQALLWWLVAASVTLLLLTSIAVAWAIVRLPEDYFVNKRRKPLESWQHRPVLRSTLLVAKNVVGIVLLVAGVVMLLAPGQGLLTIVAGLILVDFPYKFLLERQLATQRHVWRSINWIRKRFGRSPLQRPK